MINPILFIVLLSLLLLAGVWTVMTLDLLMAAIGLSITSAILAILLFHMDAALAGVFELSVCAGLITVAFISVISLTKPLAGAEARARDLSRIGRFIFLPILLVIVGGLLYAFRPQLDLILPAADPQTDAHLTLWNERRFDLAGQILIILAGIFGLAVLFIERNAPFKEPPDINGRANS